MAHEVNSPVHQGHMHNPDIIPIFFLFILGFWLLPDQDRDLQDKAQRGCAPPFLEAPP